ncbi:MAG: YhgE/Pip family protein, partial [Microbacterium hominis]|nr:YhgE/Pip family protein [Microbacterium hominis]
MRDILRLVRRDLRHATSHVMAVIVLFGLVVIPSLFTWFNVIASWDPFSNVKNLKVAVASTDDGYQSDLVPIRINVGEQVLSALRANDDLDWVITTEEDAIDGTRSGAYYAAIVLPPSFSADMLTFYADGAQRTHIAYYTNEKKNALAPKITGQGAEGLSAQISETFTRTLSDIALSLLSSLSDYLADGDTQATLARMEARVGALATQLRAGAHTADMFTALIGSSIPLADSASNLITASGSALNDAAGAVGDGSAAIDSLKSELSAASKALSDAIGSTNDAYDAVADAIDELFTQVDGLTGAQVQVIETLATAVQQQIDRYTALRDTLETEIGPSLPASAQQDLAAVIDILDDAIARQQNVHDLLTQAADDIASGGAAAQASRQQILDAIDDAQAALAAAQDTYDSQLKPQLDQLAATLETIGDDMA